MTRLLTLIAIAFVIWLLIRWFIRTPPKQVLASAKRAGLILALFGLVLLVVTGRLNVLIAAGAAALPFLKRGFMLLRYLPMLHGLFGGVAKAANLGGQGNPFSTLETRFLRASLDISSGSLDGEVLEGAFEGQFLSKMTLDNLLALLTTCNKEDPRSAALLCAYLDRHHRGWQQGGRAGPSQPSSDHTMSPVEAFDILGIDAGTNEEGIRQAHRQLIHKLHPDRGGSTYLATKINQAKDCLLKQSNAN